MPKIVRLRATLIPSLVLIWPLFAPIALAQGSLIETVAGSAWIGDGSAAIGAVLREPKGLAANSAGDLFVAETAAHRIRRITRDGKISTFAGTGVAGFRGDGESAVEAQLHSPYGLATDAMGNIYVADLGNHRVRRIGPDGVITTVAGGGTKVPSDTPIPAIEAALVSPRNVAINGDALYVSDFDGHRVVRITADGILTNIAGTGEAGFTGNEGETSHAKLAYPAGLAFDFSGALYIADSGNHAVRKIASDGVIHTFVNASGPTGLALDSSGGLWVADPQGRTLIRYAGLATATATFRVTVSEIARAGLDIFATDDMAGLIWRIPLSSAAVVIAGGGDPARGDEGAAKDAALNHPASVAEMSDGTLYIADRDNRRVRVVKQGIITSVSGNWQMPASVSQADNGNVLVTDSTAARVVRLSPNGIQTVIAQAPALLAPGDAVADTSGNVFIADTGAGIIFKVDPNGAISKLREGLSGPRGLALRGTLLYFSEEDAGRVSRLDLNSGTVTRLAEGTWRIPRGIAATANGFVFVADTGRQQILCVDPSGTVTVVAGTGEAGFQGDAGAASNAKLNFPWDVALGNSPGVLYVADFGNDRIRRITGVKMAVETNPSNPPTNLPPVNPPPGPSTSAEIVNSATLTSGPLAPGLLVWLRNTGLKASEVGSALVLVNSIPVQILTIDDLQMQFVIPRTVAAAGSANVIATRSGGVVASLQLPATAAAPALYDPAYRGTAAVKPLDRISVYGTGAGLGDLPVSVKIGQIALQPDPINLAPGFPGLFEVRFQVPGEIPAGTWPLKVKIGNAESPPVTVEVR